MSSAIPRQRFTDLNQLALSVKVGGFTSDILGWGLIEPHWWRNYLHTHSFFEICYAFQGCGAFRMWGSDYRVQAGDVFVAKPSEPHEIISSEDDPLGIYFWSYTLIPPPSPHPETMATDALLHLFLTSQQWVSARLAASIQSALELLTDEIVRREPGFVQAIQGLVAKLLLDTSRAIVEVPPPSEDAAPRVHDPADALVQQMVRYLRDNYNRSIAVRDVAAQVHLSERHTSRLFQQKMSTTIMGYLTALRMEVAAQLLLDRQLSIREVAHASGYTNLHHFTALFHRRMGLPPAEFRRKGGTHFLSRATSLE